MMIDAMIDGKRIPLRVSLPLQFSLSERGKGTHRRLVVDVVLMSLMCTYILGRQVGRYR